MYIACDDGRVVMLLASFMAGVIATLLLVALYAAATRHS